MKVALVIGINYTGSNCPLKGCVNDANQMTKLLTGYGYRVTELASPHKTTKQFILGSIAKMIADTKIHDITDVFFHYSGHGTQIKDRNGDERDGMDEAIVPSDYLENGFITDDELSKRFSGINARCLCLFDCCHSGTVLDLTYKVIIDDETNMKHIVENQLRFSTDILMISGCKDSQTSADAYIKSDWAGAMTSAFICTLGIQGSECTVFSLVQGMKSYLKRNKYTQIPQITCTKQINHSSKFW